MRGVYTDFAAKLRREHMEREVLSGSLCSILYYVHRNYCEDVHVISKAYVMSNLYGMTLSI